MSAASYVLGSAPPWLQDIGQSLFREAMFARMRRIFSKRLPFSRVLDLACGVGDWSVGYLDFADKVTGVDINQDFVDAARRRAAVFGHSERASFDVASIEDWTDFYGVDLVCLGGCAMYLDDVRLNRLLERSVAGLDVCDGWMYVRASVSAAGRKPHTSDVAKYRTADQYETLFAANGLSVVDREFSSVVVVDYSTRAMNSTPLRSTLRLVLGNAARMERAIRRRTDYLNWLLTCSAGA
jgi:SAM-dependent methyltransferase